MTSNAPIPRVVRTAPQLCAARRALGLTTAGLAKMIDAEDPGIVESLEDGSEPIPRPLTQLLEFCMELLMQREAIDERLEALMSGERLCGGFVCSNAANDITQAEIANVMVAKTMNDVALAKLMRLPLPDTEVLS